MSELSEKYEQMMELYCELKQEIRMRDKYLYERWKAGGFLVDEDIMSIYPDIHEVVETLTSREDEEEYEEEECP